MCVKEKKVVQIHSYLPNTNYSTKKNEWITTTAYLCAVFYDYYKINKQNNSTAKSTPFPFRNLTLLKKSNLWCIIVWLQKFIWIFHVCVCVCVTYAAVERFSAQAGTPWDVGVWGTVTAECTAQHGSRLYVALFRKVIDSAMKNKENGNSLWISLISFSHSVTRTMIPAIFSGMEFAVRKSRRPSTNHWRSLLLRLSMLLSSAPISNIAPYPHCRASRPPCDYARTFLQIGKANNKKDVKWFKKNVKKLVSILILTRQIVRVDDIFFRQFLIDAQHFAHIVHMNGGRFHFCRCISNASWFLFQNKNERRKKAKLINVLLWWHKKNDT